MFKKAPRKLALHRETVSELSTQRLKPAVGGYLSQNTNCPTCNISCGGTCIDFSCVCNPSWDCPDR